MPDILIRDLDPETKRLIQSLARTHRRSISDEAKALIRRGLLHKHAKKNDVGVGTLLRQMALEHGFVELDIPSRELGHREPPDFT